MADLNRHTSSSAIHSCPERPYFLVNAAEQGACINTDREVHLESSDADTDDTVDSLNVERGFPMVDSGTDADESEAYTSADKVFRFESTGTAMDDAELAEANSISGGSISSGPQRYRHGRQ